jgi:hypothetical protein
MFMSSEDARSDFILAGAAMLFGGIAVALLMALPIYPSGGLLGQLLAIGWVFVLTALVPILLVRYRKQGLEGYGLQGERSALLRGVLVAVPIVAAGILHTWPVSGVGALFGRLRSAALFDSPTVAQPASGPSVVTDLFLALLLVGVVAIGATVFYGFMTTRARDGFRRHDITVTEGLRTYGMGAAVAGLVLGLLQALASSMSIVTPLIMVVALVVTLLLADRLVPANAQTSRSTLLAPAIVGVVAQVLAAGGLFRGDLLYGLFTGVLAAGLVIVVAALIESRTAAWAVVPVIVGMALYPSCIALPVAFSASTYC